MQAITALQTKYDQLEKAAKFAQAQMLAKQAAPKAPSLLNMSKDDFAQYLRDKGIDGLYELREELRKHVHSVVKDATTAAFTHLSQEAKARVVKAAINDWAVENRDLVEDPVARELVKAIDRAKFPQYGVQDLGQLGPNLVRKHLNDVAATVRQLMGVMKGGGAMQQQPAQKQKQDVMPPSLAGVPGTGGGPAKSIEELDGFELEMAMANMSRDEIERLFEEG